MLPHDNTPPRRARHSKAKASNVSGRTKALRGDTGLSEQKEQQINRRLKQRADELHGENWSAITEAERAALCRKVAREFKIGVEQVRKVAQRMRCKPEVKRDYPVVLDADTYAFIAHEAERSGQPIRAVAIAAVRAYRDGAG